MYVECSRAKVPALIAKKIGGVPDAYDGRQTKLEGNVLFYAQHATATCCRRCAWYWYGIPRDRELTPTEQAFCADIVLAYLDRRDGELRAIEATPEPDE